MAHESAFMSTNFSCSLLLADDTLCPNQEPFGLLGAERKLNMRPTINRFGPPVANTTRSFRKKDICLRYIRSSLPLRGLEFIHFPKAAWIGPERLPRAVKRGLNTDKFMWVIRYGRPHKGERGLGHTQLECPHDLVSGSNPSFVSYDPVLFAHCFAWDPKSLPD